MATLGGDYCSLITRSSQRVSQCEGPPHSYVRMPFGLPSAAITFQRRLRSIMAAQEARHHAVLVEMATVLRELPEPPEVQDPGGS